MKRKTFITVALVLLVSVDLFGFSSGKNSSFGKWNYDKFPAGKQKITASTAPSGYNASDPCQQYIHVKSKFHVRVKNWFRYIQVGLSGYAEMRATLGTAQDSCNIPYKIARMDIWYDWNKHKAVLNSDYIRVTMHGIGAAHECYKALGYAFTKNGIVLPKNFTGYLTVNDSHGIITGVPRNTIAHQANYPGSGTVDIRNVPIDQISFVTPPPPAPSRGSGVVTVGEILGGATSLDVSGIPYVDHVIPIGWFLPLRTVGTSYSVSRKPYAGAIMNEEKGCYNVGPYSYTIKF